MKLRKLQFVNTLTRKLGSYEDEDEDLRPSTKMKTPYENEDPSRKRRNITYLTLCDFRRQRIQVSRFCIALFFLCLLFPQWVFVFVGGS